MKHNEQEKRMLLGSSGLGNSRAETSRHLTRSFLDAFEAEASRQTGMPWQWVGGTHDPALRAGVEAVRDAIAEHHKAQWSKLIDQAPTTRTVSVHGQRFDVSPEVPAFATVEDAIEAAAVEGRRHEDAVLGLGERPKVFGVDYTLGEPIPVTAESLGLGDVLRDIATAGGPLRFETTPLTVEPDTHTEFTARRKAVWGTVDLAERLGMSPSNLNEVLQSPDSGEEDE